MDYLSVNDYLDKLNDELINFRAKIIGEVTEVTLYPGRSYLFFKIKDKDNPAVLSCFMWKNDYNLCGVKIEEGLEVVISGFPKIYKALGRFSFETRTIELVGEGALKKAYEELKARLTKEGLFEEGRKRVLPTLPQKIGLITSKDGDVINDFQVNLGRYGFKISFADSRVEGQQAVPDLLKAIKTMKRRDIEILVLIRGGGSLESFLSFNNEALVREIVNFPVPVLVGIGHEEDISLIDLAADKSVSTPTATAQTLNKTWQETVNQIDLYGHKMISLYGHAVNQQKVSIDRSFETMRDYLETIVANFYKTEQLFLQAVLSIRSRIGELQKKLNEYPRFFIRSMQGLVQNTAQSLNYLEKALERENPEKKLKMGYSITRLRGRVVRKLEQLKIGDSVDVMVEDGFFESGVSEIRKIR